MAHSVVTSVSTPATAGRDLCALGRTRGFPVQHLLIDGFGVRVSPLVEQRLGLSHQAATCSSGPGSAPWAISETAMATYWNMLGARTV